MCGPGRAGGGGTHPGGGRDGAADPDFGLMRMRIRMRIQFTKMIHKTDVRERFLLPDLPEAGDVDAGGEEVQDSSGIHALLLLTQHRPHRVPAHSTIF
jgi:hypothetical protein